LVRNEKSWHLHIILFLIIDHAWSWGMVPATLHIPELGPERPQKPGLNQLYCGGVSKCTMSKNLTRPAFNATRGHLPHCRTLATLTIPTDHSVILQRAGCPPSGLPALSLGGPQRPKIHPCGISRNCLTLKSSHVPPASALVAADWLRLAMGGETSCIICFERPKSHLAVPCSHLCVCGPCSELMRECPYCREPVMMWLAPRPV